MNTQLNDLKNEAFLAIEKALNTGNIEQLRQVYLGKKGLLTEQLKQVASLPIEQRPLIGKLANTIKQDIHLKLDTVGKAFEEAELNNRLSHDTYDVSLPNIGPKSGHFHPITQTIKEITAIFAQLGFSVKTGPDIENDMTNFEKLNIPADHPSRDMHDTFYLKNGNLLRTHTSPVQIRTMLKEKPPIKILAPGKVFRCDADASHSPVFHQIEGLLVDKGVTFAQLMGTLEFFLHSYFGKHKKVRFRPSYFPFTEPSTEVDVACVMCDGKGCSLCKQTGWLEILGAGMVQRKVLENVDIDPDIYTGFAFGLGIDRMAMLKYRIKDIRLLYENDCRFLKQF
jgi:phenylalanyl-tRNA synthetase alpha chain